MRHCTQCGSQLAQGIRFCGECGAPAGAQTPPPAQPTVPRPASAPAGPPGSGRVMPPSPPPPSALASGAGGGTVALPFDWRRIVVGNWIGAAVVGVAAAMVSGVLGLALALLAKPEDFGLANTLTLATVTATGAFGADLKATGSEGFFVGGDGVAYGGAFPLTVTLIASAVAVLLFRRITRGYDSGLAAVGDAARAALIFGLALFVPTLVFRSDNEELGRGWAGEFDVGSVGAQVSFGANAPGALFLGFLVMFTLLALTTLTRTELWAGRLSRVQAWVAAPIRAAAMLLVLSPLAGAVGYAMIALFGEDSYEEFADGEARATAALMIGYAANAGVWLMTLGVGAPMGARGEDSEGASDQQFERLWGSVTEDEPGLWVAPFVVVAVFTFLALRVVRSARADQTDPRPFGHLPDARLGGAADGHGVTPLRALGVWLLSLVVVVPWLVRLSSLHGSGNAEFSGSDEPYEFSGSFGPDAVQTTLLIVLVAVMVAFVVALTSGVLSPEAMRAGLSKVSAAVQNPPGSVPGHQQPPSATPPSATPLSATPLSAPPPSAPPPSAPPPAGPWPPSTPPTDPPSYGQAPPGPGPAEPPQPRQQ